MCLTSLNYGGCVIGLVTGILMKQNYRPELYKKIQSNNPRVNSI